MNDDDLPRHVYDELPRLAPDGPHRPNFAFVNAAVAKLRAERVCGTCGGPLKGAERYCSLHCWRMRR